MTSGLSLLWLGAAAGAAASAPAADAADIVDTGGYMSFEELEARARAAYRGKRLDEAKDLLTRIIGMEPEDGTWRERRAQVLVDLKQFEAAIEDIKKTAEEAVDTVQSQFEGRKSLKTLREERVSATRKRRIISKTTPPSLTDTPFSPRTTSRMPR